MKIILSILLFCSVLLADREGGPYIGLGYGISKYDSDGLFKQEKENDSTGFAIYGGAYINKYLSVELGYIDFNSGESYVVVDNTNTAKSISFTTYNVSTLVHYAFFDDILDFYGKFGVGEMSASGLGSSGFTMLYGGGVGVRFNDMFSLKVAYDRYDTDYTQGVTKNDMHIDFIYSAFEIQF